LLLSHFVCLWLVTFTSCLLMPCLFVPCCFHALLLVFFSCLVAYCSHFHALLFVARNLLLNVLTLAPCCFHFHALLFVLATLLLLFYHRCLVALVVALPSCITILPSHVTALPLYLVAHHFQVLHGLAPLLFHCFIVHSHAILLCLVS
jgi:hypothetical protein